MEKHSKEIALKVVLVLVSIGVTIFILELGVRLLLPPPYDTEAGNLPLFHGQADILKCDNALGWTGTPDFVGNVEMLNMQADLAFNSKGMHDTEHTVEKPLDTFRILMLGDSYVHAVQVNEPLTSHQQLENYLNQSSEISSLRYEVISGGVTGWGTGQELAYYRQQGRDFKPDVVLLMVFLGNDFENNLPGHVLTINQFNCYPPYFAICDGQINAEALLYAPGISGLDNNCSTLRRWLITGMGKLYQNLRLYQQVEPLIISQRPRQMFGQGYPNPFWALYLPDNDPVLEQAWQTTEGIITQLRDEVEADGAKFGVVFFPWSVIVEFSALSPAQQQAISLENPILNDAETDRPNKRLLGSLEDKNIPSLDLTPLLANHQKKLTESLHFVGDAHWTEEGNRFVGETLSKWVVETGLIP